MCSHTSSMSSHLRPAARGRAVLKPIEVVLHESLAVHHATPSYSLKERIDSVAEGCSFDHERVECSPPVIHDLMVATRWAGFGFLPARRHQPIAAKPRQQRIDRPLAGRTPA